MQHTQDITALAIVLSAAVLCGLFMNRLRLPAAAGFILAGVVLGPTGFGLIDTSSSIETLAELGVLMLLFIIGMELRLQSFRELLPLAIGIAAAEIAATTGLAVLAAQFTSGETMSAIVIGFILAISSTAVAMKMIDEADERKTRAGRLAVAVLVAQDLAVVPLLLVTNALAPKTADTFDIWIAVKLVVGVGLLVGFITVLTRVKSFRFPFSEFFLKNNDIGTLGVLGLCFVAAAASGLIGLSPALGAFLAGLAVGHSTLRRAAMRSAPPVQNILLFTFFLSVGLLIDLHYLAREVWLVLIALFVVAAGKTLLNLAILKIFRQPGDVAFPVALFLTPIGEFSFVLAAAGATGGVLSPEGYKLALAVIALSLLVSPLWFIGARRAHELALRGITEVDTLFRGAFRREFSAVRPWRERPADADAYSARIEPTASDPLARAWGDASRAVATPLQSPESPASPPDPGE